MIRTIVTCERNLQVTPPNVITLAAATATEIFQDKRKTVGEIGGRYIVNLTSAALFVSFNISTGTGGPLCDNVLNFHVEIQAKQMLDCSFVGRCRVCAYSVSGGKVSAIEIARDDVI